MEPLVAVYAHKKLIEDINQDSQVNFTDGKHEKIVSLKHLEAFSNKIWTMNMQGETTREIKISTVSDRIFGILTHLFSDGGCRIKEYNENDLRELYMVGLELEIQDFIIWYGSHLDTKNISIEKIKEYLFFIKRSQQDEIEIPGDVINLEEFLENIINFIGTNILDISIEQLIEFYKVSSDELQDSIDFINRIIHRCEELGYLQKETHIDHIYDFFLVLIKDCSIFGSLISKMEAEKIRPSIMDSLLDLVLDDEYKEFHKEILDMQKKLVKIMDRNPNTIKIQNAQFMSFISIVCEQKQSNQPREISIQNFLEIFHVESNFDAIYNFLYQRAEANDVYTIKVACTIELSEMVDDGLNTILLSACLKSDYKLVKFLIKNKCNKNIKNSIKDDPILCTCRGGSTKIFDFLVENGLDANISNETTGQNALLTACYEGNLDMIMHLVSKGFSLSVSDKTNQNCILLAIRAGRWDIIEYLIQNDADPCQRSSDNDLPILRAIRLGHCGIFMNLLVYPHNIDTNSENDFLQVAISNQSLNIIKLILSRKLVKVEEKHKKLAKECLSDCDNPEALAILKRIDPNFQFEIKKDN